MKDELILITDLTNANKYPADDLLELYLQRWTIEKVFQQVTEVFCLDSLIGSYDLVADGSDNFTTRYLANDACYFAKKPLVSGALLRFEGQLSTFRAFEEGENRPCYRCLFPSPPRPNMVPRCETAGIFGAVAGVIGTLQATEVLKELLGLGTSLSGRLLLYEGLSGNFRTLKVKRDAACALCGSQPTIKGLQAIEPEG